MRCKNSVNLRTHLNYLVVSAACVMTLAAAPSYAADIGLAASIGGENSAIAMPIRLQHYVIQPELSYGFYDEKYEGGQYESERWNLGVFGYKRFLVEEKFETLIGLGLGYSSRDGEQQFDSRYYQSDTKGYFIAPAIALSYLLNEKLSVGVEARLVYGKSDNDSRDIDYDPDWLMDETEKSEMTQAYTDTRVTLRYYFAGI